MKPPLRYPGGKGKLASTILSYLPPHEAYVETCCGGAAVFWAKPRETSAAEVLNDVDGDLVNFYYVLRRRGRRLARAVQAIPYSRRLYGVLARTKTRCSFRRAVRFWYLNRVSFGAISSAFGPRATGRANVLPDSVLDNLGFLIDRLKGVLFECVDVVRLVHLYDRTTTCFYVDPPYWGIPGLYRHTFEPEDHERLADCLRTVRGTWLLSYNDCAAIRRLYRGCHLRQLITRYSIRGNSAEYRAKGPATELLISNRPLEERTGGFKGV